MSVVVEFTVYPFEEGETQPPYVRAAIDQIERAGLQVDLGPLGQTVSGDAGAVLDALRAAEVAAIDAGATKMVVSIQVTE
jgi:uncharacterized protein YqgV (UPF0045/DUF77 family)